MSVAASRCWGCAKGATENAAAVKALLADLVERGLDNRSLLIVIDGAKALHKAVVEVFGRRALIQRCREHKKRNVTDALPERLRAGVRSAMNQAYATRDAGRAQRLSAISRAGSNISTQAPPPRCARGWKKH